MSALATQIRLPSTCGADYAAQNPMVLQAHAGFQAYTPLYHAACLKSADTGRYCFVDAAVASANGSANHTSTSGSGSVSGSGSGSASSSGSGQYIYYLPLGVALPPNTRPACNGCLRDTMAVFAQAAADPTQVIAADYNSAAQTVDQVCGAGFVDAGVRVSNAAAGSLRPGLASSAWSGHALLAVYVAVSAAFVAL